LRNICKISLPNSLGKSKTAPHFKKYRPQAKRKAAIAAWYSRFDSGAIWNDKAVSRSPPLSVSHMILFANLGYRLFLFEDREEVCPRFLLDNKPEESKAAYACYCNRADHDANNCTCAESTIIVGRRIICRRRCSGIVGIVCRHCVSLTVTASLTSFGSSAHFSLTKTSKSAPFPKNKILSLAISQKHNPTKRG